VAHEAQAKRAGGIVSCASHHAAFYCGNPCLRTLFILKCHWHNYCYCHFDRNERSEWSGEISKRQFGQARDFSVRSLRSLSRNDKIHLYSANWSETE